MANHFDPLDNMGALILLTMPRILSIKMIHYLEEFVDLMEAYAFIKSSFYSMMVTLKVLTETVAELLPTFKSLMSTFPVELTLPKDMTTNSGMAF